MHLLKEKHIAVEVDCPDVEILVDGSRLARATSNLLDNAIHYNRQGGQVRIVGRLVAGGFALDIIDTGVGIPQEDLVRVFERFYRVEKSRTREAGGTGLGLAIAKHAIESLGGSISVTSKVGTGSTFTIFLPTAQESATATSA
jgi:two-component system phosphate regulon sensor histidine kinase PhoR